RPFIEWRGPEDGARLRALADEVYELVLDLGGTISSQHGTGLARTPWVSRQAGPLFAVYRELKSIFDPRHLLNPRQIIGPLSGAPVWPLRRRLTNVQPQPGNEEPLLALRASENGTLTECNRCNGCGECRTESPGQRMCPIFRATHDEAATPRAKANLM